MVSYLAPGLLERTLIILITFTWYDTGKQQPKIQKQILTHLHTITSSPSAFTSQPSNLFNVGTCQCLVCHTHHHSFQKESLTSWRDLFELGT